MALSVPWLWQQPWAHLSPNSMQSSLSCTPPLLQYRPRHAQSKSNRYTSRLPATRTVASCTLHITARCTRGSVQRRGGGGLPVHLPMRAVPRLSDTVHCTSPGQRAQQCGSGGHHLGERAAPLLSDTAQASTRNGGATATLPCTPCPCCAEFCTSLPARSAASMPVPAHGRHAL